MRKNHTDSCERIGVVLLCMEETKMNVLSQRFLTPDDDLSSYYRRKYDGHLR